MKTISIIAFIKKKILNIRIAGIMVLVFFLSMDSFLDVAKTHDIATIMYKIGIFLLILAFGILLVGAAIREAKQQAQIEGLAREIQRSYELEVRAYEVERKARQELENLDKTKNQFLLLIQHNLRTPLTSMMNYSDLLLGGGGGKLSQKATGMVIKIQSSTRNLIKMVNDFLDITQFQLGKDVLLLSPGIEVEPMLDEIITELKEKADAHGIYLKLEKPATDFAINADREKLKAALTNIIDNCIKYTPKGGVTVSVKNRGGVIIDVADTGIGISPENLKTIFNRIFERGEQAKRTTVVGSGIGLYLAAQIIKYHGGRLWAESPGEGKGSTFHIELPLTRRAALVMPGAANPASAGAPALIKKI